MSADETTPPVQVTPDRIFQIGSGFMAAKLLFVANEVHLFGHLAVGPASIGDLAERTSLAPRRLRILADAMVAQGLVERQGDRYQNGPVAAAFLCGQTPADMRPLLSLWNQLQYPRLATLDDTIRTGRGTDVLHLSEAEQRIFSEGVEAITAAPARALPITYDFRAHRRVLDLGGGTGSWLIALLRHDGHLDATLFELSSAAAIGRRRLADDPATARVAVVEGDFLGDPIPQGHDAVLVANVLHLYSPEHNLALLRRIREAVSDGARLLLADLWTDPTHTQPPLAPLIASLFLIDTGEGDVYSEEEGREWLQASSWRALERQPLAGPTSLIVAEAG
jgi:SAM-dependent methyltransferase